jgi:hypothetical protein
MIARLKPNIDDVGLLEEGSTPTSDTDFISEREDENPKGVVR